MPASLDAIAPSQPFTQPRSGRPRDNLAAAGVVWNNAFIGRTDDLRRLHEALTRESVALTHALTGEGGIGKSQLAARYVLLHENDWDGRWWLDASEEAVETKLPALAESVLGRRPPDKTPTAEIAAELCAELSRGKHLLVLDNLETRARAEQFTVSGAARILITTRHKNLPSALARDFPVDVLPIDDAVELLTDGRPDLRTPDERGGLEAVAFHLARHTLALAMGGAYLTGHKNVGPAELLERLKRADVGDPAHLFEGLKPEDLGTKYRLSVAQALFVNLEAFQGTPAMKIVAAAAFCHPEAIPIDLLADAAGLDQEHTEHWLGKLAGVSILNYGRTVSVHRLMQSVVRGRMDEPARRAALTGLVAALDPHLDDPQNHERWKDIDRYASHALAAVEYAVTLGGVPGAGYIANQAGLFLMQMGRYGAGEQAFRSAAKLFGIEFGDELPYVATALSNLATIQRAQGDLPAARANMEKAIAIDRKHFAEDHPNLAVRYSNLALIQQDQGDLSAARANIEKAIAIDRKHFAEDHPNLAVRYSNLALIQQAQGDFPAARANIEKTIAIFSKHLGENHPNLATVYSNLATIQLAQGDLPAARTNMEKAIAIERKHFAEDHPNLALRFHNLASICAVEKHFAQGVEWEEKALKIWLKHFTDEHPHVKLSRECLANYRRSAAG